MFLCPASFHVAVLSFLISCATNSPFHPAKDSAGVRVWQLAALVLAVALRKLPWTIPA